MSRKHKATIRIANPNIERLEELQKYVHIPFTSIANSCIYEMLGDKLNLLKEFNLSVLNTSNEETEIRLILYQSEKNYLLEASNHTGTNSLTAEIKLRLLNSIYKRRFLAPKELEAFNNMKFEINAIGRNLHQILKKIHFKEEFKIDDLKLLIEQLSSKIDDTKIEIDTLLKYTNKRFKK
ncbi:hypothetical protein [Aliarcobacter trophiarum]|uniref:hypothetical protein n=1 Tax=Aliarcobacter trophiarum TaxID=708186 RepID=UPI00100A5704|nr:hypothetical protein [Aliarcobacter trophiarum]RXI27665.1 hypothetical protein CRU89_05150 [Aliarcobacter trophiarum]